MKQNESRGIDVLVKLVETLRGENGCPWDRQQTTQSMAVYLLEEVYELLDAIQSGEPTDVCEELGDVLFQLVFVAHFFKEAGLFDIQDVIRLNAEKMIARHPHVFGEEKIVSAEEVKRRWAAIKRQEKKTTRKESVLDSVPIKLPPLMRAYRISDRAAAAGFDWENIAGVMEKVDEEWAELRKAIAEHDKEEISLEFGDLLFTLTNIARFAGIHPETALSDAIQKFEKRYRYMENKLSEEGKTLETISRNEIDRLWDIAKQEC